MQRVETAFRVASSLGLAVGLVWLSASCGGGSDPSGHGGSEAALKFCADEINMYRAMNGKAALPRSPALEAFAATGAHDDFAAQSAHSHFIAVSGGGLAFAENECPGWLGWSVDPMGDGDVTPLMQGCFAQMYAEGPPPSGGFNHYSNMLGDHAAVGCGVFVADSGETTITTDFGNAQ